MKFRFGLVLVLGVVLGVLLQRLTGVGNLLNKLPFMSRPPRVSAPASAALMPNEQHGRLALFVLAGQSNMSGWGSLPRTAPPPVPNAFVFGNDYRWRAAVDPLDDATGQVDEVSRDNFAGTGPGLGFAEVWQTRQNGRAIGLIPCAKGATNILSWQRNLSDNSLYGSCLKRLRAASTMGQVSGILFFQGESDALAEHEASARTWADKFAAFVKDMRNDLGNPDLPVVFAQIAANESGLPHWETVQKQQSAVALPHCKMIVTKDLPLEDGLHFTPSSYRVIGQRFATAWWELYQPAHRTGTRKGEPLYGSFNRQFKLY